MYEENAIMNLYIIYFIMMLIGTGTCYIFIKYLIYMLYEKIKNNKVHIIV